MALLYGQEKRAVGQKCRAENPPLSFVSAPVSSLPPSPENLS